MQIILSSVLEYCGGVKRALRMADEQLDSVHDRPVYSLGQLIHNRIVTDEFERRGLVAINAPSEGEGGVLVVRAHGMTDAEKRDFLSAGYSLVDATCPVVTHNLAMIRKYASDHQILVIGEKGHAEVNSMMGIDGSCPTLLSSPADVALLARDGSYAAFVQTTFEEEKWQEIRKALQPFRVVFVNHICPASTARRKAVVELAEKCDALIVIGGRNSANTQALASLAKQTKPSLVVYSIESEKDVTDEMRRFPRVGLATGASTAHETLLAVRDALSHS
ncbi:MAG: 4-hydroxy-3-methylbut-2-enyl diphosphate reductase [Sphaerochaetaceae bacterium]|nr:4-hydroxy-3-methylbut-2-enyl diphosphate reductase [Spirochaetales bacterium]MDY5500565.1 4-hydroxy-3-methylbut-2-enyl diphosphate reductase [Sphaerochaetaceae bacterium]